MRVQINAMKKALTSKVEQPKEIKQDVRIGSGCTLLDLACSDTLKAFRAGTMVHLVGDSSSGKSILALTLFAEACHNKNFDDYVFIYDDVEAANQFNMEKLFGPVTAQRIIPARKQGDEEHPSDCIEDFQANILSHIKKGKPFIYVLDSFDALTSDMETDKAEVEAEARLSGKETKGSYGMEKAKIGGKILRMICRKLKQTKSLLIIVSQTRDNTDPMSFVKKSVSGGRALKFYSSHQIWLSCEDKIKSRDRIIGVWSCANIRKNKATGKYREVRFPIYYDYGIDDIGACVDFLVDEKFWGKEKNSINAKLNDGWSFTGTREKVIQIIEKDGEEKALRKFTKDCWLQIEDSLKLNRKARFQ